MRTRSLRSAARRAPHVTVGTVLAAAGITLAAGPLAGAAAAAPTPRVGPPAADATTTTTAAAGQGLAMTPPMGFNDWNAFKCNVSAALIEQTADAMVANGMRDAGYQYVNIDDCWMAKTRDSSGNLVPDPAKFPDGIAAVAAYVHSKGLRLGIYEDAGTTTCGGYPGSLDHEQQDATAFAAWGVDYVKYDQCNIPWADYPGQTHAQIDQMLYTRFSTALRATGRSIVFSACTGVDTTSVPWTWAPTISNLWRTTPDIADTYASMLSIVTANAGLSGYASPGHWNDPDMLEIGNGGMTTTEYQSEFSLWSQMAAPLIAGAPLTTASAQTAAIYTNKDVIAVDQDRLGVQGRLIADTGGRMVFAKPLADGSVSVLLFNSTDTATTLSTNAAAVGLGSAHTLALTDLWTKATTYSTGAISAFVPAHGVVMYRTSAAGHGAAVVKDPSTVLALSAPGATLGTGASTTVTVTFTNNGQAAATRPSLSLSAPTGWSVVAAPAPNGAVPPGATTTGTFTVTAPANAAPISPADLTAQVRFSAAGTDHTETSTLTLTLVSPLTAGWSTGNTTGAAATFGASGSNVSILASGTGISPLTTTTRGTTAASDSYATAYRAGAFGPTSLAQVTVTGEPAGRNAAAGIVARNDLAGSGPAGVALAVTGSRSVTMVWNAGGGQVVDTAATPITGLDLPVMLRLARSGNSYTGSFSVDGGTTWQPVATATLPAAAASATQDIGVFHASGTAGTTNQADFSSVQLGSAN